LRLLPGAERGKTAVLADGWKPVSATGEDLVGVCLVTDVPENLVARRVEQAMKGDGELTSAEVGAEVPSDLTNGFDDVLPYLLSERLQLPAVERFEVGRRTDLTQERPSPLLPVVSAG